MRLRGGSGTLALVALMVAMTGGGVAVGHSTGAIGGAQTGLLSENLESSGPEVAAVQRALGMPEEAIDGVFGARTTANVRLFQTRHGLLIDGIVGPQTSAALGLSGGETEESLAPTETLTPEEPAAPVQSAPEVESAPEAAPVAPAEPAPQAAPAPQESAPAPSAAPAPQQSSGTGLPSELQRIAQCESGGNPGAVGGGGQYRGKYQFTRETWSGLGGTGDPASASEAEQDRLAAKLYSQSGSAPWGACG